MTESLSTILVIAGATATGKTGAAIELARRFDGELVGADSVQVYRGFDIGSAKPTAQELEGVQHHLIDVFDPDQDVDAAAYADRADLAIREIRGRGHLPIVVGGTGLWIRALVRGLVDVPAVDPAIRRRLEADALRNGPPSLHARLAEVDPLSAEAIHPNDALRIVRALEVYEQTGTPLGKLRAEHALGDPRYRAVFVVLDVSHERHGIMIEDRVKQMIAAGWIDEVRSLRARWGDEVRPFGSVGYREILQHLRDGVSVEQTLRMIRKSTRVYARRQRTWFKSEPGVRWRGERAELGEQRNLDRIAEELRL
ncbi:MAG: tRNA (adenosine(37)-N6)-dimethylallyltransferase MiaA [Deltaproteobacteria bacterium]|nr:tRNA (adenosine(37)-N6)-dimethylallyltransferase MiaA [Deltaproteobacteria bacterium]NND28434.1 tRNA (adenosine(37)-N6)-dimethylallyltransferase MiaA [Myxococcales bacterium]MBT8466567.1 tRNA (adenosine(37)-N6)-dimethylallyltransferase MiaA [Deltaproteobacteria bacterium]MBT8482567.1 tRNA (adenosine(37)-N6)-dimethylallyltransferase MiaA [Deltaproteobacteria bacterium]NNK06084.1 tRNA (adenosine(37)-N6)-dimethylallyltransferase MiaA [Myxococcales bacterium]